MRAGNAEGTGLIRSARGEAARRGGDDTLALRGLWQLIAAVLVLVVVVQVGVLLFG